MADTVQNRRGLKAGLPQLADAEFGLCKDSKELYIGNGGANLPVLTLEKPAGKALGIDTAVTQGSENLVTSGAVYAAVQAGGGSGGGTTFTTDDTLTLENGVLSVNTAETVEQDNTLPVTSAAVHVAVGNIEVLLQTI